MTEISMIMRILADAEPPAPAGARTLTAHHVRTGTFHTTMLPPGATDADVDYAWRRLEEQARRAAGEPVDCRHCGLPGGHPNLPACPDVPLAPPGERSTRRVPSAGRVRPRPRPQGSLSYARFQLIVDAMHGVLVREPDGTIWRDEARAPQYYTAPGREPRRIHVTGKVKEMEDRGLLVAGDDGVVRPSVYANELLAATV